MSFWSEVDNLIQKGKADKPIKVTVAELVDLRNEINDKEIKIEELEKNIEEQIQLSSEQVENLKEHIEQYQQYIQQLKSQNTGTDQSSQQLEIEQQNAVEALKQSESLMVQNQELIKQIQAFRSHIQQLENSQANIISEEQLNEKNQQITQLRMECQSLLEQIKKMQSVAINPEEFEELKRSNEYFRAEAAAGIQKYEMLQREITKLMNEIAEKDKKIKELSQPRQVMTPTLAPEAFIRKPASESETLASLAIERELTAEINRPSHQTIRHKCPNCGSVNYREVEDKSKIVSYIPRTIYGKKHVCMKCTFEW